MIRNLLVSPEGPVHQLVLDRSIKMLTANGWQKRLHFEVPEGRLEIQEEEREFTMLQGEREPCGTLVEWPLTPCLISSGVSDRRLETQLSEGRFRVSSKE